MKKILKKSAVFTGSIRFLLYGTFVTAALAGIIVMVVFRDDINSSTLQSISRLLRVSAGFDSEHTNYQLDYGNNNKVAIYGGSIVTLSNSRMVFYTSAETEAFSSPVSMTKPVLQTCSSKAIAFDRGGSLLAADENEVFLTIDGPVLSAQLNNNGWFCVITQEQGYKGVATLYNTRNQPRFAWKSGSKYITDASASPNGNYMITLTTGQNGSVIETYANFHDTRKEDPLVQFSLGDTLGLAAFYPDNHHACIVTESDLRFFSNKGELLSTWPFGERHLLGYAASEDFFLVRTGLYRNGLYSNITILDYTGDELRVIEFDDDIRAISAEGKYFSVLLSGSVVTYSSEGETVSVIQVPMDVYDIKQQSNGKVLLVAYDWAGYN